MGVLGPPVPKRIKIGELKQVTSWVLWTPFVVSVLLIILFAVVRAMIHFLPSNEALLRRWTRIRNSLAQVTSGGEFFGVYSHQSIQQTTVYNNVQREQSRLIEATTSTGTQQSNLSSTNSNVFDDRDLFMVERRIPAKRKGAWFNIYLLLLPLQVAIVTMVIVHNIYTIQYYTETCASFAAIANNPNESSYFDCKYDTLSDTNIEILKKCNDTDYGDKPISCSTYYYDPMPSHVILTILNSLLLHLTLSKGLVRIIIALRYLAHKYGKTCQEKCPCNVHGAFIVSIVLIVIAGFASIYYIATEGEHVSSDVTTSMVLFAFITISVSIVLLMFGLFQPDLYKPFARCSYNVTDEPKPENEITHNNNQEIDENDAMSNNWFCCSLPKSTRRSGYDGIE